MDATAIVCKQCGAHIPVIENVGKLVCPSCGTEYILSNEQGERILTEFYFENPFVGVTRDTAPELVDIQQQMEMYNNYSEVYNRLVKEQDIHSYKYGYWILRLRSFTEDFHKNFDRYKPFVEINNCILEQSRLSYFTKEEEECIAGYYERNIPILEARVDQLERENKSAEGELKRLVYEKDNLGKEIEVLEKLIESPETITENTKKESSTPYVMKIVCIISTVVLGLVGFFLLIVVIGLLFIVLAIISGVLIFVFDKAIKAAEARYVLKVKGQIAQIEKRQRDLESDIYPCKENTLRSFYEYKCTLEMYGIIEDTLERFNSDENDVIPFADRQVQICIARGTLGHG